MTVPFQAATMVGTGSELRTVGAAWAEAAAGASAAPATPRVRRSLRRWVMTAWWRASSAPRRNQGGRCSHQRDRVADAHASGLHHARVDAEGQRLGCRHLVAVGLD